RGSLFVGVNTRGDNEAGDKQRSRESSPAYGPPSNHALNTLFKPFLCVKLACRLRRALPSILTVAAARQKRNSTLPFLFCSCLNDYLNETSSMRKVVDSEKSVVQRYCSRIVWPL